MVSAASAFAQHELVNIGGAHGETITISPEAREGVRIVLRAGQRWTMTLDENLDVATFKADDNAPVEGPAPPSSDKEQLFAIPKNQLSFRAAEGAVALTLWVDNKEGTRLKLENNSGGRLIYVAALVMGAPNAEKYEPTTICSVDPGMIGYETWPYPVEGIMIVDFLEPPAHDGAICVDPTKGEKLMFYTLPE